MKITKDNCIEFLVEKFPEFQPQLKSFQTDSLLYLSKSAWDDCKLSMSISEFSSYVIELLQKDSIDPAKIKDVFEFIELLLEAGDDEVQTAAATCFLENILNVTPEKIDPKQFVKFLGPQSIKYCRAWDEFTGVKTEGLYTRGDSKFGF